MTGEGIFMNFEKPALFTIEEDVIVYYVINQSKTRWNLFHFKPSASPGGSWVTNNILIECTGAGVMDFLGEPDSIKTYRSPVAPFDTLQFVLSKSHGFIQMPVLVNFFDQPDPKDFSPGMQLIGFTDTMTALGYRQPQFQDYFHLGIGDILVWKDISHVYSTVIRHDTTYLVDTLQSVRISEDTILYETRRGIFDSHGNYMSSKMYEHIYLREREGQILSSGTSWMTQPEFAFSHDYYFTLSPLDVTIVASDTITHACFHYAISDIDDFDCSVFPIFDVASQYCYSTRKGLVLEYHGGSGGNHWIYLIGSIINGVPRGITELPTTSVSDIQSRTGMIYPNPTTGLVYFESDAIEFADVYDMHGSRLWSGVVSDGSLDLSDYTPGIYVIRIRDRSGDYSLARVVNQR
jgi:hypothetical protein